MARKTAILISRSWALGNAGLGAALMRCLKCRADAVALRKNELVHFLEHKAARYGHIFIVGIAFTGEEKQVVPTLERMKKEGVIVERVGNHLRAEERALMNRLRELGLVSYLTKTGWDSSKELESALKDRFGVDVSDLTCLGDIVFGDEYCANDETALEMVNAALWFQDTYGPEEIYGLVMRTLAEKRTGADMDSRLSEALAHYRRFKRRELIGDSAVMVELREKVKRISQAPNARVMIFGGESGARPRFGWRFLREGDCFL